MRIAVFGSAPGVRAPRESTLNVFSNETPCLAQALGVRVDRTVLSSFIFFDKDARDQRHLGLLEGLHLGHVEVLETYTTAAAAECILLSRGVRFDRVTPLSAVEHAALVARVTGEPLGRHVIDGSSPEHSVSTGLYCACWAIEQSGAEVCLCGLSMKPGYEHTKIQDKRRGHLEGDQRCLQILQDWYGHRLCTTSDELHSEFGIERVQ